MFRVMKYYRPPTSCTNLQAGGFKYFLCSSLPGEMIQIDEHIFQNGWVETTNQVRKNASKFTTIQHWINFKISPQNGSKILPLDVIRAPWGLWIQALQRGSRLHHEYSQVPSAQKPQREGFLGLYNSLSPRKLTCTLRIPKDPPIKGWMKLYAAGVCLGSSKIARLWRGQDS